MHSSRMRTARLLAVSRSMQCLGVHLPGGVYLPRGLTAREGVPGWGGVPVRGVVPAGGVPARRGCTFQGGTCPATPSCEQND